MGDAKAQHGQASPPPRSLPPLGPVAQRWLALRSVEDPGMDEALALLGNDAVLLEPVLAWCRARAGASVDRITSPHRALILLGLPTVRAGVVAVSAIITLNAGQDARAGIDLDGFWTHALGVSAMCERLAAGVGSDPDDAALAGLLHDCGKLVIASDAPGAFAQAMEQGEQRARPVSQLFREIVGIDHHTAGKRLMECWGLPASVRDAVWLHDQPSDAMPASSDRTLATLVSLSKQWARANHIGWCGEYGPVADIGLIGECIGVDAGVLDGAMGLVLDTVRERGRALGLGERAGVDPLAWSAAAASRRSNELAARLRDLSRDSENTRAVLAAVEAFRVQVRSDARPLDVVGAVGRSACALLGVGRVAVVWQVEDGAEWTLSLVGAEGPAEVARRVDRPPDGAQIRRPADLACAHASQVLVACELGWLAKLLEHLREAGSPAIVGSGVTGDAPGASCLVLAPVPRLNFDYQAFEPVTGLWAWTLEAAARADAARTLGEELAQANRRLTAAQDELAARESLVRLGRMAAGAAHELNNPLTVIRGRAQLILETASTPRQAEDAEAIAEAARQVSDMITSLHLLSNPPKMRPVDCDPMLVLRDAVDRARARVPLAAQKSRVRISNNGVEQSMRLDAELAAQALCEPIANAMHARPGGEVHISIESEAFTDRLKVRVMDRGPGLSVRALTHAFDPFFSEQPAGRRAGLGLARARSLVELMGGCIEVANNPGGIGGAYAEVTLPEPKAQKRAA